MITVDFMAWAECSMWFDVDDDYEIPSSNPIEFWDDLCKKYPEQVDLEILNGDFPELLFDQTYDMYITGLDYLQSVSITDDNDKEILNMQFEKIPFPQSKSS